MAIANALANEPGVVCTHEGQIRRRESRGEQLLRFLTLENRLAYEDPKNADEIFRRVRSDFRDVAVRTGARHFGDIAYNYAPFVRSIFSQFPDSKLIVFVRSGIDFVRTATRLSGEDQTPVGWAPNAKNLSAVERFVSLGRLAPRASDPLSGRWEQFDHLARNAWLWAETNRIIQDAITAFPASNVFEIRYEEFFRDVRASYPRLRSFLGLGGSIPDAVNDLLERPINVRTEKVIGEFWTWEDSQRKIFVELAGSMMDRLGYGGIRTSK